MANDLFSTLIEAASIFKIVVEEPIWVEIPPPKSSDDYIKEIESDIDPKICKIVCVVISNPDFKKGVKSFLDKVGLPSQFISSRKLGGPKGIPMAVISNILKQMNAKMRLDLYRLNLPHFRNTMVIGIDRVMDGSVNLIGCSATSN